MPLTERKHERQEISEQDEVVVSFKIANREFSRPIQFRPKKTSKLSIMDRITGEIYAGLSECTRDFGTEYPYSKTDSNSNALEFRQVLNPNLLFREFVLRLIVGSH